MSKETPTLRTPVAKIRYLGSARSGTQHNNYMRLTSIALLPLTIAFVVMMLSLVGKDYNQAHAYLAHPVPSILLLLFLAAGVFHMQLGMRTIIEDYVHDRHLKEWSLMANLFFCIAVGLACIYAVLRIGFA